MGYGQLSEHTFSHALDVLRGEKPLPQRPVEDAYYAQSEWLREEYWG